MALRDKCKEKLVDGRDKQVRMKGDGRLTSKNIKKLTKYCGKAIESNIGDSAAMKDAVWVIFYHSLSRDSMPQHQFCPSGQRSWCKYNNRALAKSEPPPPNSSTIHPDIAPHLFKIFERLSKDRLMVRCVFGAIQNQNESFNNTIWQRCPKTEFCSATTLEIAVNLAVISFNAGQVPFAALQEPLRVTVSPLTMHSSKDHHRVSASVMKAEVQVKRRRLAVHQDRVILEEQQVEDEGETYGAGRFWVFF